MVHVVTIEGEQYMHVHVHATAWAYFHTKYIPKLICILVQPTLTTGELVIQNDHVVYMYMYMYTASNVQLLGIMLYKPCCLPKH